MHDRRVARADDVLVVQDRELRLELAHGVYGVRGAREDEPRADVLVVDPASDADSAEMAHFTLRNSRFEEANSLYRIIAMGKF